MPRISVNVPDVALEPWQVVVKDWGESQGMAALLVKANLIQAQPVGALDLNHGTASIFAFTPEALKALERSAPAVPRGPKFRP